METSIELLKEYARKIRIETLTMIHESPAGHPGGSLSVADIMAVLYLSIAEVRPNEPDWPDRDRVILSKGHACAAWYAALGLQGFFSTDEFKKFRRLGGLLEGHPNTKIPGVDAPSGSLGMGLSQGLGVALGGLYTKKNFRVYVILGDGDMQEGSTWEAIMAAAHHKVDNLCVILDYNKIQAEGWVSDYMDFASVAEKFTSFHWDVQEIDGHDCSQILTALQNTKTLKGKPSCIIAHTCKGKGVSFMENQAKWHGCVPVSSEVFAKALIELKANGTH